MKILVKAYSSKFRRKWREVLFIYVLLYIFRPTCYIIKNTRNIYSVTTWLNFDNNLNSISLKSALYCTSQFWIFRNLISSIFWYYRYRCLFLTTSNFSGTECCVLTPQDNNSWPYCQKGWRDGLLSWSVGWVEIWPSKNLQVPQETELGCSCGFH